MEVCGEFDVKDVLASEIGPIQINSCQACGSTVASPRFSVVGLNKLVVVCDYCGLGRLEPMPTASEISDYYFDNYYGDGGKKFGAIVEKFLEFMGMRQAMRLTRGLSKGARVLDIGCGRGILLGPLLDLGFDVHGVEYSESAIKGADERAVIRISSNLTEVNYTESSFDLVIMRHVLEHLPNPVETIEEIYRILRPRGRLVVEVPNFSSFQSRWAKSDWFHLDLPRHLFQFTQLSLAVMLKKCGFRCLSTRCYSVEHDSFGWIQSFLNRLRYFPRNSLYLLMYKQAKNDSLPSSGFTPLMLKIILVVGIPVAMVMMLIGMILRNGAIVEMIVEASEGGIEGEVSHYG